VRAVALAAVFLAVPDPGPTYLPPVAAEVVDPFRPPTTPYAPGNRGIDYATAPGTPVTAAAAGIVAFAGSVGGALHVTVLHPDGIRTSYSFVQSISVRRGDRVTQGQELARAGSSLHFGARLGDEYLDPRRLLSGRGGHARLVPDDGRRPETEAHERGLVVRLVRSLGPLKPGLAPVRLAADTAALGVRVASAVLAGRSCTAADQPVPPPRGRRIVVLVGGFGSSSASAAVDAVDTRSLGYAPDDRHRFSYRGGTVEDHPYSGDDAGGDLRRAGDRLALLLRRLSAAAPGVPVDVIAHSQGGLVARWALSGPGAPRSVETLVTLGTPHLGADLAAAVRVARRDPAGLILTETLRHLRPADADARAPALGQLAPGSAFLRDLAGRRPPPGLRITSVAARGDAVVAPSRSRLRGARNVVVTVDDLHDHARLPGSPAARREVALAVAGLPPTCRDRAEAVLDVAADAATLHWQRVLGRGLPLSPVPLFPVREDGRS
jgi:hypothetical protein